MIKIFYTQFIKLITQFFTTQIQGDRVYEFWKKKNSNKKFLIFNEKKIFLILNFNKIKTNW